MECDTPGLVQRMLWWDWDRKSIGQEGEGSAEIEQPTGRCSEPAAESADGTMSTRTNAGNWYAHRDGWSIE